MNTQNTADRVTLSLPQSVRQRLDAYAADQRRSRSNAASLLLAEALMRVRQPRTPAEEHCRA
jgi:metal-responsive CopG/Arc/MetJ family transcriptional regulator